MPKLFDTHTHLQFAAFEPEGNAPILRALDAGIWLTNVGTQIDTSKKAIAIAEQFSEGVYATVGLHPTHAMRSHHDAAELGGGKTAKQLISPGEMFDFDAYKTLALHPKVVAIGECGLDYFHLEGDPKEIEAAKCAQKAAFELQIKLAKAVDKPLMIHCRDAWRDCLEILTRCAQKDELPTRPGIAHFFAGTAQDADALIALGFSFSFGGVTTFTRDYDEVIRRIPLDKLLLETDAPYVAPVPFRGRRNESLYTTYIATQMAKIRNMPEPELAETTVKNARNLFMV